ncbi:tail protein X [Lentibacillus sp. Marseille-P4043]|uniref:tail protein X n=1 Tax=Lentibacillus sp. Marseille-P4043 TaxID=2040293 RepID=UPI001F1FF9F2|nr:tail protein X [Lentibacillus sp. Marseille-P4043]
MKYRTVSGDTFDKVAYEQYGDEKLAINIIEANLEYAHVIIFGAGVELVVPEIDTTPTPNLPPWKRGDN